MPNVVYIFTNNWSKSSTCLSHIENLVPIYKLRCKSSTYPTLSVSITLILHPKLWTRAVLAEFAISTNNIGVRVVLTLP